MKITIGSPDGLGDFVLRIPFFEALRDAGHDLQIFMRPPASDLAPTLLPTARIERISEDPYARLVRFRRNPSYPS
jgi:ADP-heptose:LPS heptosyltransferase